MEKIAKFLKRHWQIILISLFFISITLAGIQYCLPMVCNVDEPEAIRQVQYMLKDRSLEPSRYNWPGHFESQLLVVTHVILKPPLFILHKLFGTSIDSKILIFTEGRVLTAFFSGLSLLLIYAISQTLFKNKAIGVVASVIYAINPVIQIYSKQFRADVFLTFLFLLALYLLLEYQIKKRSILLLLGGFSFGLAVTSKYIGLLAMVPFGLYFLALIFKERRIPVKEMFIFVSGWFGGIVLGSPYFLLNIDKVIKAVRLESRSTHLGGDGLDFFGNMAWYIKSYFNIMGNGIFVAGIGGMIYLLWQNYKAFRSKFSGKKAATIIPILTLLIFFVSISYLKLHWVRWMIPVIPFLAIFAAYGLHIFNQKVLKGRAYLALPLLIFLLIPPTLNTATFIYAKVWGGDTRLVQREWNKNFLKEGAKVTYEGYTAQKPDGPGTLEAKPLEQYRREGYQYLIASSTMYSRYFAESERYKKQVKFYQELFKEKLVAVFTPAKKYDGNDFIFLREFIKNRRDFFGADGPEIRVYKIQ